MCYNRAADEERDLPTETPPPYFPQNPLSPGDAKTARRVRLTFYGCAALAVLTILGAVAGIVYVAYAYLLGR